ncbi:hypothetical protein DY023_08290 [Microbacterium bovistercoris]|uniref:PepSY domain-containing protein n=1 Tax=Microbacterium bovistercoris TaxID=2293570 RepID=A0A371NUD4_9MICO|nr:hypothetical protein [Microbacterium bovistercoris]REJ05926.1 hypothetical protein DY023_08290 [Microbacterium bovistercoris]
MDTEKNTPQDETPTARMAEQPADAANATASAQKPKRRPGRIALIAGAAAVALVAVGGGAYAVTGGFDDDRGSQGAFAADHDDADDAHDADDDGRDDTTDDDGRDDKTDDDGRDDDGDGSQAPADAASLRAAAESAIAETGAQGATSIEAEHGGYEVELRRADGIELDAFVATDGTVRVASDDDDDRSDDALIDLHLLSTVTDAAVAAAGGTVEKVSTTSQSGVVYEVELRTTDGRDAEVLLDADAVVVATDLDD